MKWFELWTPVGIWVQEAVDCLKPAGQKEKRVREKSRLQVCSISNRKAFVKSVQIIGSLWRNLAAPNHNKKLYH